VLPEHRLAGDEAGSRGGDILSVLGRLDDDKLGLAKISRDASGVHHRVGAQKQGRRPLVPRHGHDRFAAGRQ
jgi:hypothetical protein